MCHDNIFQGEHLKGKGKSGMGFFFVDHETGIILFLRAGRPIVFEACEKLMLSDVGLYWNLCSRAVRGNKKIDSNVQSFVPRVGFSSFVRYFGEVVDLFTRGKGRRDENVDDIKLSEEFYNDYSECNFYLFRSGAIVKNNCGYILYNERG